MKNLNLLFLVLISTSVFGQNFYSEFAYETQSKGKIVIENSYPKGGQKYRANDGEEFVFLVFWNRITNETDKSIEVDINFSSDTFTLPSSPNVYFNALLPSQEMFVEKDPLKNYGLDVESFLTENLGKSSKFQKSITPGDSCSFYVVVVSNEGINGTVRAEFELSENQLLYSINEYKMECGQIISLH